MTIKTTAICIRTIKPGDPLWTIADKYTTCPRAGFHIKQTCPENYAEIIKECIDRGWLRPVAYMLDREMTFELLAQDNG